MCGDEWHHPERWVPPKGRGETRMPAIAQSLQLVPGGGNVRSFTGVPRGTVSIGGRKVNNLRFADDIDLLAGSNPELAELTGGMEVNLDKSKILAMNIKAKQPDICIRETNLRQLNPSNTSKQQ